MAITEFAIVSLKLGIDHSDPRFQEILKSCTRTLLFADGGTGFQFLRQTFPTSTPAGELINRICLLGSWQTVQQHASFLLSGQASELLGQLVQYVNVEVVHHIDNDRQDVQLHKGGVDVDIFVVKKEMRGEFDRIVHERGEVGGWKFGKKDKGEFGRAIGLVREQSKQEPAKEEDGNEESDIWMGLSNEKIRGEAAELREKVEELVESVEVLQFGMLK